MMPGIPASNARVIAEYGCCGFGFLRLGRDMRHRELLSKDDRYGIY